MGLVAAGAGAGRHVVEQHRLAIVPAAEQAPRHLLGGRRRVRPLRAVLQHLDHKPTQSTSSTGEDNGPLSKYLTKERMEVHDSPVEARRASRVEPERV